MQGIGAGIMTLHDIININKWTDIEEVRTFFQVMEVYGQNTDIHDKPSIGDRSKEPVDNLAVLRTKSLD